MNNQTTNQNTTYNIQANITTNKQIEPIEQVKLHFLLALVDKQI